MLIVLTWCWPAARKRGPARWALVALAVLGVCSMTDGATSMDCTTSVRSACDVGDGSISGLLAQLMVGHTLSGLAGFAAAGLGAACCARAAWSVR